jgi:dUTP pyrophosphatase
LVRYIAYKIGVSPLASTNLVHYTLRHIINRQHTFIEYLLLSKPVKHASQLQDPDPKISCRLTTQMILPGCALLHKIVRNIRSPPTQCQPCGIDLTLKRILNFASPGSIDFSNNRRKTASTEELPFRPCAENSTSSTSSPSPDPESEFVDLPFGVYLVEFNETVDVPLDLMGQIFVRSSLVRSGALVHAGVMDSGYYGAVGALLQVMNPHGLRLFKDARIAQLVFHQMSEKTEGYKGVYQGSVGM